MSGNSSDIFKAMANTASVIVNNTPGANNGMSSSEILRQNNAYKTAIHSTLRRSDTSTMIHRQSQQTSLNRHNKTGLPRHFERRKLTEIPDEMLYDIPKKTSTDEEVFSLFQGFNAVLPEINEALEMIRDGKLIEDDPNAGGGSVAASNALPKGITEQQIKQSQNPKQLTNIKDEINYKLDLLEIKKGLSSNEIVEIDGKIKALQLARQDAFNKIKRFEQDEIYLENQLYELESRLMIIKNVEPVSAHSEEDDTDAHRDDESDQEHDENDQDHDDDEYQMIEPEPESNLMTKSIYGKLRKDNRSKQKAQKQKQKHNRKTKPTLQTYYEPGSMINSFEAHDDSITSLDFDIPFGTAVTSSLDNTVRVWDLSRSKCTGLLEGHNASVKVLQMEDNLVVTGSNDATLKLWDLQKVNNNDTTKTGNEDDDNSPLIHSFDSHVEEITALNFHNNILVSGSSDRTIRQWDLNTGHCLQTIDVLWAATQNSISHSQFLSSSSYTAATSGGITTPPDNAPFIGAVQVYEAALATGTADGLVRLWDLRSGEVIRQLVGHTGPVTCLQFDDKNLTTGSTDRSIRIWDLRTGGIVDAFAYESPIVSLQFDSRRIVSINDEPSIKVYDRIEERHWSTSDTHNKSNNNNNEEESNNSNTTTNQANINCIRYKDSYVVAGGSNGEVSTYAV